MHRRLDRVIYGWQNGVIHSTSFSRWCIFIIISSFLLCVLCFVVVGRLFVSFSLTVSLSLSLGISLRFYILSDILFVFLLTLTQFFARSFQLDTTYHSSRMIGGVFIYNHKGEVLISVKSFIFLFFPFVVVVFQ